jgi:hypothetical protein
MEGVLWKGKGDGVARGRGGGGGGGGRRKWAEEIVVVSSIIVFGMGERGEANKPKEKKTNDRLWGRRARGGTQCARMDSSVLFWKMLLATMATMVEEEQMAAKEKTTQASSAATSSYGRMWTASTFEMSDGGLETVKKRVKRMAEFIALLHGYDNLLLVICIHPLCQSMGS